MDLGTQALSELKKLQASVVDVLSNSPLGQHVVKRTDTLVARWRWHDRVLGYSIRVPITTELDYRHSLALLVSRCRSALARHTLAGASTRQVPTEPRRQTSTDPPPHPPHAHLAAPQELVHAIVAHAKETHRLQLPPTTLALVAAQLLVFNIPDGVPLKQVGGAATLQRSVAAAPDGCCFRLVVPDASCVGRGLPGGGL
jgi:hypothetical protein